MTFDEFLLDAIGDSSDVSDMSVGVTRCYFYDFDGYPVRLWDGEGLLYAGGFEWVGTTDADGQQRHVTPNVRSIRDGSSPDYDFEIPYLDATTYAGLKADQDLARGRTITSYYVGYQDGEGLRPETPIKFDYQLTMVSPKFSQSVDITDGKVTNIYTATISARGDEFGRSRMPNGIYTDTAQQEIARLNGVASDSFCSYVAANSQRTITIEG